MRLFKIVAALDPKNLWSDLVRDSIIEVDYEAFKSAHPEYKILIASSGSVGDPLLLICPRWIRRDSTGLLRSPQTTSRGREQLWQSTGHGEDLTPTEGSSNQWIKAL